METTLHHACGLPCGLQDVTVPFWALGSPTAPGGVGW